MATTNDTPAPTTDTINTALSRSEYERLAQFRHALRHLTWQTEQEVRTLGVTPQQYQLLLAIKGFPGRSWATITELAERLQLRHNAIIGLVNRAETRGLVVRRHDSDRTDKRIVQIYLTPEGERILAILVSALRSERQRVSAAFSALLTLSETADA